MQNKKCVHCKEDINKDVSRCPKCGGKNYVLTTGRKILYGIIIIFGMAIVIGVFNGNSENPNSSGSNNSTSNVNGGREIMSKAFAEETIKNLLKSPSTAEFSNVYASELSNQKDVWEVFGYVDSQNSFSAMIRNVWKVQLDFRDGKGGSIKTVIFDGKKVI